LTAQILPKTMSYRISSYRELPNIITSTST
jgi:hypothetical protein